MNKMHTDVDIIRLNEFSDFPCMLHIICANDRISFDFFLVEKKKFFICTLLNVKVDINIICADAAKIFDKIYICVHFNDVRKARFQTCYILWVIDISEANVM